MKLQDYLHFIFPSVTCCSGISDGSFGIDCFVFCSSTSLPPHLPKGLIRGSGPHFQKDRQQFKQSSSDFFFLPGKKKFFIGKHSPPKIFLVLQFAERIFPKAVWGVFIAHHRLLAFSNRKLEEMITNEKERKAPGQMRKSLKQPGEKNRYWLFSHM